MAVIFMDLQGTLGGDPIGDMGMSDMKFAGNIKVKKILVLNGAVIQV